MRISMILFWLLIAFDALIECNESRDIDASSRELQLKNVFTKHPEARTVNKSDSMIASKRSKRFAQRKRKHTKQIPTKKHSEPIRPNNPGPKLVIHKSFPPISKPPAAKPPIPKPPDAKPIIFKTPVIRPHVAKPPILKTPVTKPPVTKAPVLKPPVAKPPVTKPPDAKPIIFKTPVIRPHVAKPPILKTPVTKPPVTKPPVTKAPVHKPPVAKPPVTKPSVPTPRPLFKTPVIRSPVTKSPVFNQPVAKPPVSQPPLFKPPANKAPVPKLGKKVKPVLGYKPPPIKLPPRPVKPVTKRPTPKLEFKPLEDKNDMTIKNIISHKDYEVNLNILPSENELGAEINFGHSKGYGLSADLTRDNSNTRTLGLNGRVNLFTSKDKRTNVELKAGARKTISGEIQRTADLELQYYFDNNRK